MIILEKHGEATELTSDFHGFPSKEYTKLSKISLRKSQIIANLLNQKFGDCAKRRDFL